MVMKLSNNGLVFLCSFLGSVLVAFADDAQMAPLNPAFVADQNARKLNSTQNLAPTTDGRFGYRPAPVDLSFLEHTAPTKEMLSATPETPEISSLPSTYDLRTLGRLTPVKDQGAYGTCWAHATFGSMESCLVSSTGETNDFSENNLVNLHGFDNGFDDGGNAFMSMAYLLRWNGPLNESSDPYPSVGTSTTLPPVKHIQQVRMVLGKSTYTANDAIKQAVIDNGAVYANYFHDSTYYNSTYKSYYCTKSTNTNHAVAIVGWDDSYSSSKFNSTPAGNGAYIVRNSWGPSWGDKGYYYVSYYDKQFAWYTMFAFMNAEPTNTYKTVYQYDPLGYVNTFGYGTKNYAWGANMFTASSSERLGAVGFYAVTTNTTYNLYVYTGAMSGSPRSGTLATTKSGTCALPGYYTIPLDRTVQLTSGQLFSIVIKFTTPGYYYPIPYEYAYSGFSSAATASAGQSYYSSGGSTWSDLYAWNSTANVCIKAYVPSDQTLPTVTVNQAAEQADPTNGSPIVFAAVFSEAVTNFGSANVTVAGTAPGTQTATVSGSGSNYTISVSGMTGSGTVIVSIPAGAVTDLAFNPNTASTSTDNSVQYNAFTTNSTPYSWLDAYGLVSGGNYAAAEAADTDGDGYTAGQEYVAGTNPTNAESVFRANIAVSNGVRKITWTPDLSGSRVYTVYGKSVLTNAAWQSPTNAATRFFRPTVSLP